MKKWKDSFEDLIKRNIPPWFGYVSNKEKDRTIQKTVGMEYMQGVSRKLEITNNTGHIHDFCLIDEMFVIKSQLEFNSGFLHFPYAMMNSIS